MKNRMTFRLTAKLTCKERDAESLEVNHYKRFFFLQLLKKTDENATIYNEELDMYFENTSASASIYEVETKHVTLDLCDRLKKLEDLTRRFLYRFDWIQVKLNQQGKVLGIENTKELQKRWQERLKKNILADYEGDGVDAFVVKIDADFSSLSAFHHTRQYFQQGLLFPEIPAVHRSDWENRRIIRISEYEDETFEEFIRFEKKDEKNRSYLITGKESDEKENKMMIDDYKGRVIMPENGLFPEESEVNIVFHTKLLEGEWNFKLTKI